MGDENMTLVEFVTRFYAPALTEHQLDLLRRVDQDRMVEGELALQRKRLALANQRRMTPIPLPGQIMLVAFDEASEVPDAVWARAAVEPADIAAITYDELCKSLKRARERNLGGGTAQPMPHAVTDAQAAALAPDALDAAIAASSSIDQAAPAAKDLRVATPDEREAERKRLADFFAKNGVL